MRCGCFGQWKRPGKTNRERTLCNVSQYISG